MGVNTGLLIGLLLFFGNVAVGLDRVSCGGDGPQPFQQIEEFEPSIKKVETLGSVRDFMVLENKQAVVYRNSNLELRKLSLEYDLDRPLTRSYLPLARFMDDQERYLITEDGNWIFDMMSSYGWLSLGLGNKEVEPLFWEGRKLYLMEDRRESSSRQILTIYDYNARNRRLFKRCSFRAQPFEEFHLVKGGEYPYVSLYRKILNHHGHNVIHYNFNVRNCTMHPLFTYKEALFGAAKNVFRFNSLNAYAVELEHPTLNTLWATHEDCRYFNIKGEKLLVPSLSKPVLAAWKKETGLHLFRLDTQKKALILKSDFVSEIAQRDLWLTLQNHLFMSVAIKNQEYHKLFVIDLEGL